jgi:hypothetical protein
VDIVIEGKITVDEPMSEVLQTVIDLKSLQNAILRINNSDSSIQGKIAFAQGGYILGASMTSTGESGYDAVRKLLSVTDGNYAVLDPGRNTIGEINQTLWLNASRVLSMLPNLPQTPEVLCDANPDKLKESTQKSGVANLSLNVKDTTEADKPQVKKGRAFDIRMWRAAQYVLWCALLLTAVVVYMNYGDSIMSSLRTMATHQ